MKAIPKAIAEAALVDGAAVWLMLPKDDLPLCRPAFAALATLQRSSGSTTSSSGPSLIASGGERPVTSAINNLQGPVPQQLQPHRRRSDAPHPDSDADRLSGPCSASSWPD